MNTQAPSDYTPYQELTICSNKFINGKVPIEVKKSVVLLVGKGEHPLVWINTFTSPNSTVLIHLVEKNQPIRKEIHVLLPNNETIVSFENTILLQVKQVTEDNAEIVEMDLRPIGLDIHGDNSGLYVGTNQLVNNTFTNVPTMIGIG
jgi:hypothetical protein